MQRNPHLAICGLIIAMLALGMRFLNKTEGAEPERSPSPSTSASTAAAPSIRVDRDTPWQPGLRSPDGIGPVDRAAPRGAYAMPMSATRSDMVLREDDAAVTVPIFRYRYDDGMKRWTNRDFKLVSGWTITAGTSRGYGLVLEAAQGNTLLLLPSFGPLLTDSGLWPHEHVNNMKYDLGRGLFTADNYALQGIFVGKEAVFVLVVWHAARSSAQEPVAVVLMELRPSSEGWKGRPIWKSNRCWTNAFPLFVPFRDCFFIYDGAAITWFHAGGQTQRRVVWNPDAWPSAAQYHSGLILIKQYVSDTRPEREEILAADAWTGKLVRKFVLPGRD